MEPQTPKPITLTLDTLTLVIGSTIRWKILAALSQGGPLMVSELSAAFGVSMSTISKQMTILREARVVEQGRGRMYAIVAHFRVSPGVLNFGYGPFLMRPGADRHPTVTAA